MDHRKIDALIAEKIFGWTDLRWVERYRNGCFLVPEGWYGKGPNGECYLTKSYSTNIADAWLVVEKFRKEGTFLSVVPQLDNYAVYGWCNVGESDPYKTYPVCIIEAEIAPLAICLAALKACGVEVDA